MIRRPHLIHAALSAAALFAICALAAPATAQTSLDTRVQVISDLRTTVPGTDIAPGTHDYVWARTDNIARITAAMSWGSVNALVDFALVYSGRSDVEQIPSLTGRPAVDPYYFESDALFVEIVDFLAPGVDLRLGRQVIQWGTADMFNPTAVINGYDLEDPLDFGKQVPNETVSLSINPDWYIEGDETPILDEVNLTLIAVPRFRSGLIPSSGLVAFQDAKQFNRFVNSDLLAGLLDLQVMFEEEKGGEVYYESVTVEEPESFVDNSQIGARFGFSLLGIDLSAMAYKGYDHNLQAKDVVVTSDLFGTITEIDVEALTRLLDIFPDGTLEGHRIATDVVLYYPKVTVVGGDFATSLDALGGLGVWAELAVTYHDGVPMNLTVGRAQEIDTQVAAGSFWKLTAGMDYTFTRWLYANVQYLHGFVDEFGTENINDYVVAGLDFKTFDEQVLLRLFGLYQLQDEGFIAFPQLSFRFWQSTELLAGALLHAGRDDSKFGNRTAGPNLVFVKGRYSF